MVFLSAGSLAGAAEDRAQRLLERGLQPSSVAYQGVMTVTHWYGSHTRAEEVRVHFKPPNYVRREFLEPNGKVRRVVISDGKDEEVFLVRPNRTLTGCAVKRLPKQMPTQKEWALLAENYKVQLLGAEMVSGRQAWVVELQPRVTGKLIQRLWLDKETGVILENKRYLPNNNFVILSRYNEFETNPQMDANLFALHEHGPAEDHEFSPEFLTTENLKASTGHTTALPTVLPYGFTFESADFFSVDGKSVDHFRYTDGLSVISVFQTSKPVRLPEHENSFMNENGMVMHVKLHGQHYTVVGDMPNELLQQILAPIK